MPEAAAPLRPVIAERRIVSVLFVDLVGFTSFSEARDPEDVRALVTRYFDLAREVVERFGGTVDKFIGDAVMAWWGATASQEDDAERAVRAALELVERVRTLGEEEGIADLAARAGVMTGEASVGPGGNEKGLLLGDLVNSASRLQSLAEPGTVLVGATTADLVAGAIDLVNTGSHMVKGKEDPIVASRALRTAGERGGRGRAGIVEPPFVGRTSELRLLKDMLHAVGDDGRSRLVSLVGQAGIGKSRLVWEFRKYVDGLIENVYWHAGRSPSYGDAISLWALAEMIRHRARIHETDDDETTRRRLGEAVAEHVSDRDDQQWINARLADLLGVGESATQEREELFAAARAFFERLAAKGTVVLVFEDLHWADPSLLEFIEELADWSQNHPILVITMTRPELLERRPDWGSGRRGFTSLYVGPLTEAEMSNLIEGTVPGIPTSLTSRIVATAGGVPLFAVEMIRMLIGDGRLVVDDSGVVVGEVEELEVPTSVQAVISARLDRLPPEERELSRDAAVLGYAFTIEGLAALRDESLDKLERRLSDLMRREILELVRDPLSPEQGQYRWVQSMLREVAYGRIARADRRTLHLLAARYFRDLDDPELAPVAAAHFVAAGEGSPDRALEEEMVETLHRAIERARSVHAHEQVLSLVETSLPLVPDETRVDLHEAAGEAAIRLQDNETADRHVMELGEIAAARPGLQHRAIALRGHVANETRRSEPARPALEAHLAAHPDIGDDPHLARIAVQLARARLLTGDMEGASELADRALGATERLGLVEETADALVTLGSALATSRIGHGMAVLWGGLEYCRRQGLVGGTTLRALINIGYVSPDSDEMLSATHQVLEEAKRIGDRSHALFAMGNLIEAYTLDLRLDEAEELLADPLVDNLPPADEVVFSGAQARMELWRGRRVEADSRMLHARALLEVVGDAQLHDAVAAIQHNFLLMDMDFGAAYASAKQQFENSSFLSWVWAFLTMEGAALAGDVEWVEEVGNMASTLPPGARADRLQAWVELMRDVLSGRLEDAERARTVARAFQSDLLTLFQVEVLASVARHLPSVHPSRSQVADEARHAALAAGATGLAEWVDRVVDGGNSAT